MKVAIIGAGVMGRWLAGFAKKNLGEVTISDVKQSKAEKVASELGVKARPVEEAAADADIVLVAVPIPQTPEVVKAAAKMARKGALVADVASVKSDVVKAMHKIRADVELVSIHPLFGPGASKIKGKDFVVVPVKPGKCYVELKKLLVRLGARVTEMDAEEHDRVMAIIQCTTHFVLLAYLHAIKSMKESKRIKELRTPMFARLMAVAKSILAGDPELYGELQTHNKYAKVARSGVLEACRALDSAFSAGDARRAKTVFNEALAPFGAGEIRRAYRELYRQFEGGAS